MKSGVAGGSFGEVGPRGEVPVQVVRHPEEKAGDLARSGEKARPGGGFGVSLPLLAPWTRLDRRPWGQDGGLSAPGTPSFAPWDVGVDHEPERVPSRLSVNRPSKRPRPDLRVPELCPVRRGWGGSCPLATPRQGMQGQDEAPHRFWRGLALVELWGPRPRVPPYPGPRDMKGERGGKVGRGRAFPHGLGPSGRGFCNPARPKPGMGRDHWRA